MKLYHLLLDWSEAWAPLIPLIVWFFIRPKHRWLKPVLYYLILAFLFSLALDIIWKRYTLGINEWIDKNFYWWPSVEGFYKNTIFYNLISISRLLMFAWFFSFLGPVFRKLNYAVIPFFIIFTIVNFIWFEKIEDFSSRLITLETGILLFYSVIYFFKVLRDDSPDTEVASRPVFLVVTGLSIYVALNFFIFLFYKQLTTNFVDLAKQVWPIHNFSNIIFCLLLAFAFKRI
jgi:hypothetical protein